MELEDAAMSRRFPFQEVSRFLSMQETRGVESLSCREAVFACDPFELYRFINLIIKTDESNPGLGVFLT